MKICVSSRVSAKVTVFSEPCLRVRRTAPFDTAEFASGVVTRMRNRAFLSGSSKQGKKRRASAASSCVAA